MTLYDKMSFMKRPILSLLSALFVLSTLFSSLHELMPHHSSSDCQVCTLLQHDDGLPPLEVMTLDNIFVAYQNKPSFYYYTSSFQTGVLSTRAPPLFS